MSVVPRATTVVRAFTTVPAEHPVLTPAAGLAAQHRLRTEARRLACDPHADDHSVGRMRARLAYRQLGEWTTAHHHLIAPDGHPSAAAAA